MEGRIKEMKKPIHELSETLSNLISAGEVVERPTSVIKELVENSMDAEATSIKIDLKNSGFTNIIVRDNGYGMTRDEIPFALKRHATSKITTIEDLFSISSLGFRGEALPSIASVSRMKISSCTDGTNGYMYQYNAGECIKESAVPLNIGTTIEVSNLFYNTPARLKNLKTETSELNYTLAIIGKIALARHDVAITVTNNNKVVFQTLGTKDTFEIISEIYGFDVCKNMLKFSGKNDLYSITGFTTNNSIYRSNKYSINIIVNNRIIQNPSLYYAITDSYKTILPEGKYPITILNINCDYGLVDVNVHPSKLEIRFTEEQGLKNLITKCITDTIQKSSIVYQTTLEDIKGTLVNDTIDESYKATNGSPETLSLSWDSIPTEVVSTNGENSEDSFCSEEEFISPTAPFESNLKEEVTESGNHSYEQTQIKEDANSYFSSLHYIGQYHRTYLLLEKDENLFLIDQHAAMERCRYEKILKSFQEESKKSLHMDLLIPINIQVNAAQMEYFENHNDECNNIGLFYEPFGRNTLRVRSIPLWIHQSGNEVNDIQQLFDSLWENKQLSKDILYDRLAKTIACKGSITGNETISKEAVEVLLKEMDKCKMPYTCPHGRPTIIKFTKYEIEKMFKRVM